MNNLLVSTAFLLAAAPALCNASSLRSGSSGDVPDDHIQEYVDEDLHVISYTSPQHDDSEHIIGHMNLDDGFEVVGGGGIDYDMANLNNSTAMYEWHQRSMLHEELELELTSRHENDVALEEAEEEEDAVPKEYINDDTLVFVEPEDDHEHRHDRQCGSDELLWTFKFRTDQYAYETSWKLEQRQGHTSDIWKRISFGPPNNRKYHDNTVYRGSACLQGGWMYKLTMMDAANDGMCCNYGKGTYSYSVNNMLEYDSKQTKSFKDKAVHDFYIGKPVPRNNGNLSGQNGSAPGPFSGRSSMSCPANQQEIGIKIKTDKYGAENTWEIRNLSTNRVVKSVGLKTYKNGASRSDSYYACVPYGKYRFTMTDGVGDGICCGQQGDGRYELLMDGELMAYGSDYTYGKTKSHDIIVGYHTRLNGLSQREVQYLNCHNWRRKQYHEQYGATYTPVKYDLSLQRDAKSWADELLDDCAVPGIKHEPGVSQGENLAKNVGTKLFGQLYPVENICRRWFEREETWPYPDNAHLTQGLWLTARYVGCAESEKSMPNGRGTCRVQVCRYARAGNCNMGAYKANQGDNWKTPMLQQHNPCGPVCPPNGCH